MHSRRGRRKLVLTSGLDINHGLKVIVGLYGTDPAPAGTLKVALDTITLGIDSSDRFVGCLWVLLVSWAALRAGGLPKGFNYLGLVIGVAGLISTAAPVLNELGIVFGVGILVGWILLGSVWLRSEPGTAPRGGRRCRAVVVRRARPRRGRRSAASSRAGAGSPGPRPSRTATPYSHHHARIHLPDP